MTRSLPTSLFHGDRGLFVASAAFCGFAFLFALVRQNRSAAADLAITLRLQRRRVPWLSRLMAIVSWPGFPPQSFLLPVGLSLGFWSFGRPIEAIFQSFAWGTAVLSTVSKSRMRRPRPIAPLVRVVQARLGGSSFPSGHVLSYVGVYGFLAYSLGLIVHPVWLRRLIVAALCSLLALVGPSRIYQGHHWPTDVFASYLLGLSYLIGLAALYRRALARWERSR
jgi:undecaprenyl-diphosphatase